jgi:hypothetical protein
VDSSGNGSLVHGVPELLQPDLPAVVGEALGQDDVEVLSAAAESIIPPGANMTTGGLWRVRGTATASAAGGGQEAAQPFSVIAKLTQSPLLWPGIGVVPEEFRQQLAERYLWRTEAQAYAAGISAALPADARMPETFLISELSREQIMIWMEDVRDGGAVAWTDQQFGEAAHALGGLAGSAAMDACIAAVADAADASRLRFFLEGVGAQLLIPAIKGDDVWRHPAVAAVADPGVVSGLRRIADGSGDLVEELAALPQLPMHGDASPQNLLADNHAGEGPARFVLIDWGSFGRGAAGFDLAQLLAGRVNDGLMPGTDLYRLAPLCVEAYCSGMADAGTVPDPVAVARGQVAAMAVFSGLFALPLDRLGGPPEPGLERLVAGRLDMVRFIVDRLKQTAR